MYTVLICDDDKDIVSALEIYLASEGYRTVPAFNGEEAIAAVRGENIDLILMDVMMPKLDGIRTTARLREEGGNIPIILLTAKSEDTDKVLGLNIGADDYITKPFNPIEVLARVKSQLRRYTTLGGKASAQEEDGALRNGSIIMDDEAKAVYRACPGFRDAFVEGLVPDAAGYAAMPMFTLCVSSFGFTQEFEIIPDEALKLHALQLYCSLGRRFLMDRERIRTPEDMVAAILDGEREYLRCVRQK